MTILSLTLLCTYVACTSINHISAASQDMASVKKQLLLMVGNANLLAAETIGTLLVGIFTPSGRNNPLIFFIAMYTWGVSDCDGHQIRTAP